MPNGEELIWGDQRQFHRLLHSEILEILGARIIGDWRRVTVLFAVNRLLEARKYSPLSPRVVLIFHRPSRQKLSSKLCNLLFFFLSCELFHHPKKKMETLERNWPTSTQSAMKPNLYLADFWRSALQFHRLENLNFWWHYCGRVRCVCLCDVLLSRARPTWNVFTAHKRSTDEIQMRRSAHKKVETRANVKYLIQHSSNHHNLLQKKSLSSSSRFHVNLLLVAL